MTSAGGGQPPDPVDPDEATRTDLGEVLAGGSAADEPPSVDELPELPPVEPVPPHGPSEPPVPPGPSATPAPGAPPPAAPVPWSPPPSGYGPGGGAYAAAGWAGQPPTLSRLSVPGAPGLEFAGAGTRLLAWIVDGIVLAIVGGILAGVVSAIFPRFLVSDVYAVLFVVLDAAYFIGLWMSSGRATLGMRLLKLQVGNAFDGQRLTGAQAVKRWLALGGWLYVLTVIPGLVGLGSSLTFLWYLVVLATTAASPTKQGIHDRVANTAVVRPAGQSAGGLVMACLVILVVLAAIAVLSIIALIFLGAQVSTILSSVGESV